MFPHVPAKGLHFCPPKTFHPLFSPDVLNTSVLTNFPSHFFPSDAIPLPLREIEKSDIFRPPGDLAAEKADVISSGVREWEEPSKKGP